MCSGSLSPECVTDDLDKSKCLMFKTTSYEPQCAFKSMKTCQIRSSFRSTAFAPRTWQAGPVGLVILVIHMDNVACMLRLA
jgi:hypothetical protein